MKQTDITDYSQFMTTASEDEHIIFDDCEVDARTHGPDKASKRHSHEETHIIFVRTGTMYWEVEDETLEAGPGDTIVTPPGVEHEFEVVGDEPAKTLCIIAPARSPEEQTGRKSNEITKPERI